MKPPSIRALARKAAISNAKTFYKSTANYECGYVAGFRAALRERRKFDQRGDVSARTKRKS